MQIWAKLLEHFHHELAIRILRLYEVQYISINRKKIIKSNNAREELDILNYHLDKHEILYETLRSDRWCKMVVRLAKMKSLPLSKKKLENLHGLPDMTDKALARAASL
jgi:hypothetical protein